MSRIPESLTEFICVVVTYPLYFLVHCFIGYEYLQVEEKESLRIHFTPIVIGVSFAFLSYGLFNDYLPYLATIWSVEVVNNYAKLIVLLATGAISRAYRNLVDISSIFIRSYTVMECLR